MKLVKIWFNTHSFLDNLFITLKKIGIICTDLVKANVKTVNKLIIKECRMQEL